MRGRNWVLAGVLVVAVIAAGLLAGHPKRDSGAQPRVAFGASVQPTSAALMNYVNGWTASDGSESIGVYAGSQRSHRRNGIFVIARLKGSHQRVKSLVVKGSGSLTLLRPARPDSEAAAYQGTLRFVTASGATGTLDLSSDSVTLSR